MPSDIEDRPVAAAVLSYIATRGFDRSLVGPGHVLRFQIFDHNGAIGLRDPACHTMGPMLSDACNLYLYRNSQAPCLITGGRWYLPLEPGDDLRWWQGQDFQDIEPAFSGRGDDGPDVGEDLRTLEGAEGSRDFHAHLHHAQVPLGLIVGEGDCEV